MGRAKGFTLVELIMVMVLLGIMSVFLLPNLSGSAAFRERGFRDGVFTTVSHARRVAMASRRYVCVNITAGTGSAATVSVTMDAATTPETAASISCTQAVALPSTVPGCGSNQLCAPSGVALGSTSTTVRFDPMGRSVSAPNTTVAATITITNQSSVTVAGDTGLVQ